MADTKISALSALSSGGTASGDLITLVDVSDTTMAGTGTNKKITLDNFFANMPVGIGFGDEEIANYDEGSFTTTLTASVVSGSHTYTAQSGTYTRIGNMCFGRFRCWLSSKDALISGDIRVSGLPFTVSASNLGHAAVSFALVNGVTFTDMLIGRPVIGSTYIELREIASGGSSTNITDADLGTPRIECGFFYMV